MIMPLISMSRFVAFLGTTKRNRIKDSKRATKEKVNDCIRRWALPSKSNEFKWDNNGKMKKQWEHEIILRLK